jgi:hypothetical protein
MDIGHYSGSVVKRPFATGSKSQRDAIFLVTKEGDYVLRRPGGNAFFDPELEQLVGKKIKCTGTLSGYTLLINDCAVV